jgi:hypothetical protein
MGLRYAALTLLLLLAGCAGAPRAGPAPRLYLAGIRELWIIDTGTGRVRHEHRAELAPGDPPHMILARGRRIVMGAPFGDRAFFLPSARPDRVWVVDLRPGGDVLGVREVTVDGETTVPATRPPTRRWPVGAVADGVLLPTGDDGLEVWNPQADRVVRRLRVGPGLTGPVSAGIVTACEDPCAELQLVDAHTGAARMIRAPTHLVFDPWSGAFSPSGDLLAVGIRAIGDPETTLCRLALIDVRSGRVAVVPGSEAPPGYTLLAWSASGRYVFMTGGDRGKRRVIVGYRLGTRHAERLNVHVGDFYDIAAV